MHPQCLWSLNTLVVEWSFEDAVLSSFWNVYVIRINMKRASGTILLPSLDMLHWFYTLIKEEEQQQKKKKLAQHTANYAFVSVNRITDSKSVGRRCLLWTLVSHPTLQTVVVATDIWCTWWRYVVCHGLSGSVELFLLPGKKKWQAHHDRWSSSILLCLHQWCCVLVTSLEWILVAFEGSELRWSIVWIDMT